MPTASRPASSAQRHLGVSSKRAVSAAGGPKSAIGLTTRSVLRYPGGKSRAISLLERLLPPTDIRTVLSPFLGGGSFELHLTGMGCTVSAFDAYAPLANFWHHLLTNPVRLASTANKHRPLTPQSFKELQQRCADRSTSIADAAAYLAVNRSSFSGSTLSGGFSKSAATGRFNDALIERVRQFRNSRITVQQGSFEDTISSGFDFIFADPPYWLAGSANKLYGERGNMHDEFDHLLFRQLMGDIPTPWLVTYNDAPQLRELWRDFHLTPASWAYGMNSSKQSSELIITNYALANPQEESATLSPN